VSSTNKTLVCFSVIVEFTEVVCQINITNFTVFCVREVKNVINKLFLVCFLGICTIETNLKNTHKIASINLFSGLVINSNYISHYVFQFALKVKFPLILHSQSIDTLTIFYAQILPVSGSYAFGEFFDFTHVISRGCVQTFQTVIQLFFR